MQILLGLLIPFFGTSLGSSMVFLMKNHISSKVEKLLIGFASGVMIAAAIWSLLIPSIDMSYEIGVPKWFPAGRFRASSRFQNRVLPYRSGCSLRDTYRRQDNFLLHTRGLGAYAEKSSLLYLPCPIPALRLPY